MTGDQKYEQNCNSKAPIGISRFNNTTSVGGGTEPRGTMVSDSIGPFAQVTSAEHGVSFKLPLKILPPDVQIGNIITLSIQRNPIEEQKRQGDILSI